ncbi:hypothetical protein Aduo_005735 [Ancylostoma duodenale]
MAHSASVSGMNGTSSYSAFERNCTGSSEVSCCHQLLRIASNVNNKLWADYKKSEEHLAGADLYTTVILGLFASIIILLMFRSIRWKESLDDQVTLLLSSMQLRVEHDEGIRQKKKMREAKQRAQLWLAELKAKSLMKIPRKQRSASFYTTRPREISVSSVPTPFITSSLKAPTRAKSYNGTLPAIVVQDEPVLDGISISRATSRQSSIYSDLQSDCSFDQEVFRFPVREQNGL